MELDLLPLDLPCCTERPFIIAGPCSAETEDQVMNTAKQLAGKGFHIFPWSAQELQQYSRYPASF